MLQDEFIRQSLDHLDKELTGGYYDLYSLVSKEVVTAIIEDLRTLSKSYDIFPASFSEVLKKTIVPKWEGRQIKGGNPVFPVWLYVTQNVKPESGLLWRFFHGEEVLDIATKNINEGFHFLSEAFIQPSIKEVVNPIIKAIGIPTLIYFSLKIFSKR